MHKVTTVCPQENIVGKTLQMQTMHEEINHDNLLDDARRIDQVELVQYDEMEDLGYFLEWRVSNYT